MYTYGIGQLSRWMITSLASFACAAVVFAQVHVTGRWTGSRVEASFGNRYAMSVTFVQNGSVLTGSFTGAIGVESDEDRTYPVSGGVNDGSITFRLANIDGDPNLGATFTGSVAGNQITGSYEQTYFGFVVDYGTFQLSRTGKDITITALIPSSGAAGGPGFDLRVIGTNFSWNSMVLWNGVGKEGATRWVSSTELIEPIPQRDIASPGTAEVRVGDLLTGAVSNSLTFTITGGTIPPPPLRGKVQARIFPSKGDEELV